MKLTCSNCGEYKEPDRLYSQRYCRKCHAEWMRINRRRYNELSPTAKKKSIARSYAKVYRKKGVLKRLPCFQCGQEITQFHHADYDMPLNVISLCRPCHLELHRNIDSQIREETGLDDSQILEETNELSKVS